MQSTSLASRRSETLGETAAPRADSAAPSKTPLVTFMIATHNRVGELERTLEACLEQTWPRKEILVVDDASTDGTYELVRGRFPEVGIVRNEHNLGSIGSRNKILRRAAGRYIIALDDDSRLVDEDACARIVQRMEAEPDLGICSLQVIGPEHPERLSPEGRLTGEWHCSSFAACGAVIRRALLDKTGLLPEFFFHAYEEPDLCLRAWDAGYRVLQWNDVLVYHAFSPLNRNEQRVHHRHARNEACSIAMRYPWHLVVPATLCRLASQARYAARRGWLLREPRVWWDYLRLLPQALRRRESVGAGAVKISLAVNRARVAGADDVWSLANLSWRRILRRQICASPSPGRELPNSERGSPTVVVAHSGKQHAYRHALAVQRAGALLRFVTSGYYRPDRRPDRWLARSQMVHSRLRRRHLPGLESSRVTRCWPLEIPELAARGLLRSPRLADRLVQRRDARFDRWVAERFAAEGDIYWGFQGSCLESARAARRAGRIAVVEFATAHVTAAAKLLAAEAERFPAWADSISNFHFPAWYRRRLEEEPHAADFCVAASGFTRQSLLDAGVAPDRIRPLPLGADLSDFHFAPRGEDGPFRILFVGGVGQRKGIKYLLDAFAKIRRPGVELVVAGPISGGGRAFAEHRHLCTYLGRLDQQAVVREMHRCHVLVLPSVFEGFGLVIPEAMATGMPVIASTHSAAPEIVREGRDGFVLAPDDVEGLAERLDRLASNRRAAVEMGREASRRAREFSWEAHAGRVRDLIDEIHASRLLQAAKATEAR